MQPALVPAQLTRLAALLDEQAGRWLVCKLYDVPDSLTDLVVESAVSRAGTVAQSEG